jgi:putative peptide zinc metalloprotease protein
MTVATKPAADQRPVPGCPRRRAHPLNADHPETDNPDTDRDGSPLDPGSRVDDEAPRLADGVQLLGEYAGTGYRQPQHVARRPGGQMVQLSRLLQLIAERCDGHTSYPDIAGQVSGEYGKTVSPDNVRTLVRTKLRPLGILADEHGASPPQRKSDPLLALKLRTQLLTPRVVGAVARLGRPVFWPPVVVVVLAGLAAVDVWLFFVHGVGSGLRATVQQPAVFLLVMAVIVVSAGLHELGHAAACAYGGAHPGGMGAGIYVVWPAFYTDVTDAYRLDRPGRLRTDLGGVYVNAIIVIATAAGYAATGYEPLVLLCFLLQILVLQQMLPFLRLDGYYVLSDLVGVPDLFRRIGPVLRSAIPFRQADPAVAQLKPWVRRVVATWVFLLVPVLAINIGYFLLAAPRILATGWASATHLIDGMTGSDAAHTAWSAVQLLLLLLPALGLTYTVTRTLRRGAVGAWRWSAGAPIRRTAVISAALALTTVLAILWYPDGRMTPYRDGERDTLQDHLQNLRTLGQGHPVLTFPDTAPPPPSTPTITHPTITGSTVPPVTPEPTTTAPPPPSPAPPPPAPPNQAPAPAAPPAPEPPAPAPDVPTDLEVPTDVDVPTELDTQAPTLDLPAPPVDTPDPLSVTAQIPDVPTPQPPAPATPVNTPGLTGAPPLPGG